MKKNILIQISYAARRCGVARCLLLTGFATAMALSGGRLATASTLFWNTNGTNATLTSANWSTTNSGPYTTAWTNGSDIDFEANSLITNVSNTPVGNINVANGFSVNLTSTGTYNTGSAVRTFTVGSGSILDFGAQAISTAGSTGFTKNGPGIYFSSNGNAFTGGFTLSAGTFIAGGTVSMGSGGSNTLTINGGTIAANNSRTFATTRFPGGITVGGDFTLGGVTTGVTSGNGSATANIEFDNNVAFGTAIRTITIGSNGIYTLAGTITGGASTGLNVNATGTGSLVLSGSSIAYPGATTINSGKLFINGTQTGAGAYSVASTGTLGGSGSITTASNAGVSIATGGLLSPGTGVGTLGTLTMNLGTGALDLINEVTPINSQSLLFDLNLSTNGNSDQVKLTSANSTLNIGNGLLEFDDFNFTTAGTLTTFPNTYVLFDTNSPTGINGSLGNQTGTINGLDARIDIALDGNGNQEILLTVPEPSTIVLGGIGAAGLMLSLSRRRKVSQAF